MVTSTTFTTVTSTITGSPSAASIPEAVHRRTRVPDTRPVTSTAKGAATKRSRTATTQTTSSRATSITRIAATATITGASARPKERQETDSRLRIERERTDEILIHRDDFLAMLSHDMRSLLVSR
jgi:hypothetical protein